MSRESDVCISFGVGLLAGVVAGILAGVLTSPKSGEDMRADFVDNVKSLKNNLMNDVSEATESGVNLIDKTKASIENQIKKIADSMKARQMAKAKKLEEAQSGIDY